MIRKGSSLRTNEKYFLEDYFVIQVPQYVKTFTTSQDGDLNGLFV